MPKFCKLRSLETKKNFLNTDAHSLNCALGEMDGDVASIPVRKSAVQQLQEQMRKELDDKEAEFSAFKEKTKK